MWLVNSFKIRVIVTKMQQYHLRVRNKVKLYPDVVGQILLQIDGPLQDIVFSLGVI